ncbi:hypothetical protein GCM10010168_34110 [Actinoplanes ianthinogenes]|uniref:Photosystem I assembly protein Ycf4 n=1 Tax=Actinoplanes ianthinogenes TaxID=122358 RepID=A0ABM7M651_9ACTN|nr:hypothetical protein [Actinoplanes ianthinogenes]BCJ47069.1 hypothetical protein Aiant_77260 [Actinoplanes ianthinogenes]GGR13508.1 hypothetical protein GCM10010168_34110 [Actinoplanes ianthinogenes]
METPTDVSSLAYSRGLGQEVADRSLPSPLKAGGTWLGIAAGSLLLLFLASLGHDTDGIVYGLLRLVGLFFCFLMVYALAMGIRTFIQGAQSYYVFTGGFVHRRNGRAQAYTWSEIAECKPLLRKGQLINYQLVPRGRKPINIPVILVNNRDAFLDSLMGLLHQHGIPVS